MPSPIAIALLSSNSIFLGLAVVAVLLRFILRQRTVHALGTDDWLILAALFCAAGLCLTNIIGIPVGHLGQPLSYMTGPNSLLATNLKFQFTCQFFCLFGVAFVKLSVLQFYGRFFRTPTFLRLKQSLVYIVTIWLVAFFWATLFQAWPLQCNWVLCTPTTHYPIMYICSSATDVFLDCIILAMPLAMLRHVDMDRRRKVALGLIFGLGIFCIVASVARLVYTIRFLGAFGNGDLTPSDAVFGDEAVNIVMWSGIENCASVIAACLPCFGPLLTRIPAVNRFAFKQTTFQGQTPSISDERFTGGARDTGRGRRLRLSELSAIDTKTGVAVGFGVGDARGRRNTDGSSSVEFMLAALPSPLLTPKVRGAPTRRDWHEPEVESGKIHLRTASEETVPGERGIKEGREIV